MDNEDDNDTSEIIAESMVGGLFFELAKKALEDLETGVKNKGGTLTPQTKQQITDAKTVADNGKTTYKSTLDSHVKK